MIMENIPVIQKRGTYLKFQQAVKKGSVTIGFMGGSITEARVRYNWPEFIINWLKKSYPHLQIVVENAAIGATSSDSGVFRAERDIISRNCDLIFVEYTVNDEPIPTRLRQKSREGLIRKLKRYTDADLALVYTNMPEWFSQITQGKVPDSIAEFEAIAEYYHIDSIWVGLFMLRQLEQGTAGCDLLFPDGLHPQAYGSSLYAQSVIQWMETVLSEKFEAKKEEMLPPMDSENWEQARLLDMMKLAPGAPWHYCRSHTLPWADIMLMTTSYGAQLQIPFTGTGLCLFLDFGKTSSDFRFRIDRGAWQNSGIDYPEWCGDAGWLRTIVLAESLERKDHILEIETLRPPFTSRVGSRFEIAMIGIVP